MAGFSLEKFKRTEVAVLSWPLPNGLQAAAQAVVTKGLWSAQEGVIQRCHRHDPLSGSK